MDEMLDPDDPEIRRLFRACMAHVDLDAERVLDHVRRHVTGFGPSFGLPPEPIRSAVKIDADRFRICLDRLAQRGLLSYDSIATSPFSDRVTNVYLLDVDAGL